MNPIVLGALITAATAIIGALLTLRANRQTEDTKVKVSDNTNSIETIKIQMAGWKDLADAHVAEIDRTHGEIDRLTTLLKSTRLELEECREECTHLKTLKERRK